MDKKYDVIILATERTMELLGRSVKYLKRYLNGERYICIGPKGIKEKVRDIGCDYMNEDTLAEGLTYKAVSRLITSMGGKAQWTGHYYQQFLKMAYCEHSRYQQYVVWDSDTIPLRKFRYFEGDKLLFTGKKEYYQPYFDSLERLFSGEVHRYQKELSFIAENMIIDRDIMKELIARIESNEALNGKRFFEKIMSSVNMERDGIFSNGFSEFETYGNYVMKYHKDRYNVIRKKSLRSAANLVGFHPSDAQLKWLAGNFAVVSIENKTKSWKGILWQTWFSIFFKPRFMQKIVPVKKAAKWAVRISDAQARMIGLHPVEYNEI